jgi:hypothetical protein
LQDQARATQERETGDERLGVARFPYCRKTRYTGKQTHW